MADILETIVVLLFVCGFVLILLAAFGDNDLDDSEFDL